MNKITFFTSPQIAKIDPTPVINEIKSLGEHEDNRYSFLKQAKTKCLSDVLQNRLIDDTADELSMAAGVKHPYSEESTDENAPRKKHFALD